MRAARLLRILLLLQNRGRMTSVALAAELEVAPRTILRDLDALAEAGLPVVVHRGAQGGIQLAFNYRTRLTGLAADEAEALGVMLSRPAPELEALGIGGAARRAAEKLFESLPDAVRARAEMARGQFRIEDVPPDPAQRDDPRVEALAGAVRKGQVVRLQARSRTPRVIHPVGLLWRGGRWCVVDALAGDEIVPSSSWGDVNISARRFTSNPARVSR